MLASFALFVVACTGDPDPTATPSPQPTATPQPEPTATPIPDPTATPRPEPITTPEPEVAKGELTDEEITIAYVEAAIARYERDGLEATAEYYNTLESIKDERDLTILTEGDQTLLATPRDLTLIGTNIRTGPETPIGRILADATAEGHWAETLRIDHESGREVPALNYLVLHDGLIFASWHSVLTENLAGFTQSYVQSAIDLYEREGLQATIDFYDSAESVDGQFYLFLIDENDQYLAHPIFPHLKGTDIKDVVGSNGYELGKEIAKATEEGHWVEYPWPHPVSGREEPKTAWVIRHDGLIFASGHYTPGPNDTPPEWIDADPVEHTVAYVEEAVDRYKQGGLQALLDYYNSVASFHGQFYLFATDADDIYIVHPLFPHLRGTDIKDVVDPTGFALGEEFARVGEEPVWIEYLWPHPITLLDEPKVAYAVRHDGIMFASGYYPIPTDDPVAYTQQYVQDAIERYERDGREATFAYYSSEESIDGQWNLTVLDPDGTILLDPLFHHLVGTNITAIPTTRLSFFYAEAIAKAKAEGIWLSAPWNFINTTEQDQRNIWIVKHDGFIFMSSYYSPILV